MVTHHPGPTKCGFVCEVWKADFKEELERAKDRWAWHVWNPELVDVHEKNSVWIGTFQRYSST